MSDNSDRAIHRRTVIAAAGTALLVPDVARGATASAAGLSAQSGSAAPAQPITAAGVEVLTPQRFYEATDRDMQGAFERMIARARSGAFSPDPSRYNPQASPIVVPPGLYLLHDTLQWQGAGFDVKGFAKGNQQAGGSVLRWTADVTGMIVHRFDSQGEKGSGARSYGADGSIFEGLRLQGHPRAPGRAQGLVLRARCELRNMVCESFSGDGIHVEANEASPPVGNANHATIDGCVVLSNWGNGLVVAGDNANALIVHNLDASGNGRFGLRDISSVSNLYVGGHNAANGQFLSGPETSAVSWHRRGGSAGFYQVMPGQATAAATTEPGTNAAVWRFLRVSTGASATLPEWSRRGRTAYVEGGAAYARNGAHRFVNPYMEGTQGAFALYAPGIADGGSIGCGLVEGLGGIHVRNDAGILYSNGGIGARQSRDGRTIQAALVPDVAAGHWLAINDSADRPTHWVGRVSGGVLDWLRGAFRVWRIGTDGGFHPSLLYVGTLDGNRKARLFRTDGAPGAGQGSSGDIAIALSFVPGQPYMWGKEGNRWVVLARVP